VLNLLLTLSLLSDDAGNPGAIATIAKDITARKQAEEKIKHMDCYDSLTGLPNHKLFKELLSRAIANAHRHEHPLAVLFLDLDNFKDVNSTLGHTVGDRLLKAAADRLKWSVRAEGTVARMVGVEFAVLLPEIAGAEGATTVAQKVLETIGELVTLNNHKLNITTSIGIAFYPEAGEDPEVLLRNADIAMCAAKKQGGNNLQFYTT
jgi:diguanylate cyclase (GGDEF)-like protein